MHLSVSPGRDICGLLLVADTTCLPLPAMEALLLGIEKIVTEAAYQDIAVADIPALTGITSGAMKLPADGLPVEVVPVQVTAAARLVAGPRRRLAVGGAEAAR